MEIVQPCAVHTFDFLRARHTWMEISSIDESGVTSVCQRHYPDIE
jgi:hypothetical protein